MKTVQNTSSPSSDYRDLPLEQLVESPTNPRKHYDDAKLQELAETIRGQSILEPLLVREIAPDRFEIIAGSRRFRAAQLAAAERVPVRVLHLDDAGSMLAQVVENGQREDIHPLEEAKGFRALLDLPNQQFNVASIAAKAGKTAQYVAQRLKLTELIGPVADAFLADRLTIGHALLIAKLPPTQQAEALQASFKAVWTTSGETETLIPVKELAGWIASNLLLDLQTASFDRTDASLVSEAGSCHDCPKRTGANSLLFPETDRDQCLDRQCYQTKVSAHVAASIERHPKLVQISTEWGSHGDVLGRGQYVEIVSSKSSRNGHAKQPPDHKKCPHIAKAIVVQGGNCGRMVDVCADPACETHHAESRKRQEAFDRARAEQGKQNERRKQEMATRSRLLTAILEKVSVPLTKADLDLVAREFIHHLPQQYKTILAERHQPPQAKRHSKPVADDGNALRDLDEAGYSRLLIEVSLLDPTFNAYSPNGKRLEAVAKRYRLNVAKIAEAVAADFATRKKKRDERRGKAANGGNRVSSAKGARKRRHG